MSGITASISTAGNALEALQQALSVIQNNINNASTPGYASQSLNLEAMPMDIGEGLVGGVMADGLNNSRDQYAEEAVQSQTQQLGFYTAQAQNTGTIQSFFDVTGASGVSSSLSALFQSFSAWSTTPDDPTAQQNVLAAANTVAQSFQGLANSLTQTAQQIDGQVGSTVQQINAIATQIQQYNVQKLQSSQPDPGEDAQLYSALDSLSQLTNFTTVTQSDGTVTVLLAGGTPLVDGTQQNTLSSNVSVATQPKPVYAQSLPTDQVLDAQGNDITSQITGGQLGGLLDARNRVLAGIMGDSQQQGTLNQLAQGLADTVNQILESGTVSTAAGAASGTALFTYDSKNPATVASTLALNPSIAPDQLAPVDSSGNANGNANALAALENATGTQGTIGGLSYLQYFGQIAANAGQENQTATANEQTQQQVVAQATTLRGQVSGVSLDAEASAVLQFQQAYQATAQVLTVLDNMGQDLMNLIVPT
ncbi:MAG: flagellar hook-associated protein FlgK [Bryobacteraceae bacterium]|jgi:flagellar hook-associated protein 1 FlgK